MFLFRVSKLGELVAAELTHREAESSSGRLSQSPPGSPKSKMPQGETAPASNESGYKSSPNPSDPGIFRQIPPQIPPRNKNIINNHIQKSQLNLDNLSFSIPAVDSICQENELIRQGVQQLQNKINQFQRRDGLGGSPLPRIEIFSHLFKKMNMIDLKMILWNNFQFEKAIDGWLYGYGDVDTWGGYGFGRSLQLVPHSCVNWYTLNRDNLSRNPSEPRNSPRNPSPWNNNLFHCSFI